MLAKPLSKLFRRWRSDLKSQYTASNNAPVLPDLTEEQRRSFEEDGFVILQGAFQKEAIDEVRAYYDRLWERRQTIDKIVCSCFNGEPHQHRAYFRNVPEDVRHHSYTLLDPHLEDAFIRDTVTAPQLINPLRQLLQANPIVCNSLIFERGSQQNPHFDTFFMSSKTPNKMAASWIAVDNVTEDAGPLYYYPKSHLIEPYRFSHGGINAVFSEIPTGALPHIDRIISEYGLKQEVFLPQAGDALIWHAQLLHGACRITNPVKTRRSLVTHYWTDIDFPDPEQRWEYGDGRWVLKRDHQWVEDAETIAEAEQLVASLDVTEEMRSNVPDSFDPRRYLTRNQDILRARANPWLHYAEHGRREGRIW